MEDEDIIFPIFREQRYIGVGVIKAMLMEQTGEEMGLEGGQAWKCPGQITSGE